MNPPSAIWESLWYLPHDFRPAMYKTSGCENTSLELRHSRPHLYPKLIYFRCCCRNIHFTHVGVMYAFLESDDWRRGTSMARLRA